MDRNIVYLGAVPLDTDYLQLSRQTMVAIGYLVKAVLGDDRVLVDGLNCVPGSGSNVVISPGTIFKPDVVDAGYYGALPPDADPLVKAGSNTASTVLSIKPGQLSVISASMSESLSGDTIVAYYNSSNPSQTLFGPQGNGQTQASMLTQKVSFSVDIIGCVPQGSTPIWHVNVPVDATYITEDMITIADNAPFLKTKLPSAAPIDSPVFVGTPTAPTPVAGDISTKLATTAYVNDAVARNRAAWGTAGKYAWVCPPGVKNLLARLWAAGGNGGAGNNGPGGGGGGGGYLEVLLSVVPGTVYSIQVGGSGGTDRSTVFDTLVTAGGGLDGLPGTSGSPGAGGASGTVVSNSFSFVAAIGVSPGKAGFLFGTVPVGGCGGSSYGVSSTTPSFVGSDLDGTWPGGAGGGSSTGLGGRGADGLLILEWGG